MKIFVAIVDSKGKKQTFPIREKPIIIGRSKKSHVTITDDLTSSQHFQIYINDGCVYIEDLNSKNGIYLNGIRVLKQRIYIEDKVKLGDTMLYFDTKKMDDATTALLTSQSTSRPAGELTIELETHKDRVRKSSKSSKLKEDKLFEGVEDSVRKLKGQDVNLTKERLLDQLSLALDVVFALIFVFIPFLFINFLKPDLFAEIVKEDLGYIAYFSGDALYVSCGSLLIGFIFYRWNRGRDKGSIGEKILGID